MSRLSVLNLLQGAAEDLVALSEKVEPVQGERLKVLAEMTAMVYQMASEVIIGMPSDAPETVEPGKQERSAARKVSE